ncbi:unnamed protein product [Bursaphelenchus xylophilus]|uniref:(pine wood nematode) hypothetical protein n=1 Tax=Bursaphelenchus xylophilus TaxID=6326 RepID=A0A7I8X035_BURXY|nr:unnamed protein product [Bursaphelenchus xylophilus]CAG9129741.1 unnamed protein product [Bursaphelenchus xylophilus]
MKVTVVFNDLISLQDVSEDLELESLMALLKEEWPSLIELGKDKNFVLANTNLKIAVVPSELKKSLKTLGFSDDELVYLMAVPKTVIPQAPTQQHVRQLPQASQSGQIDLKGLIAAIKVPKKGSSSQKLGQSSSSSGPASKSTADIKAFSKKMWEQLKADPHAIRGFKLTAPSIANAFETYPNDFENFHKEVVIMLEKRDRLVAALKDETSAEAQEYIARQIKIQNIEDQYQYALEHLPEAYIPVKLLHIHVKINGVEVLAMVDSGAQNSIINPRIAKKCNIYEYVDERFFSRANGIGGDSKIIGRIHSCKMQIGSSFITCPFDVLEEQKVEILLGLSFLRPNACIIDLRRNVLVLGDDNEVPFLGEEQYKKEVTRLGHSNPYDHEESQEASASVSAQAPGPSEEVDSAKLAELISMGMDPDKATIALKKYKNDLQRAIDSLFDEPMDQ